MKFFVSSLIQITALLIFQPNSYAQYGFYEELNSGVTTELLSSSNCLIGSFSWYGWACGINGTVIKSSPNYSSQWRNVSGNGIPSNVTLDNICGIDSNTAFVAGHLNANTWVWKTTNGGLNWLQVFTQPNGRVNAVWMNTFTRGFIQGNPVGGRWSIWRTTNGGTNWDSTGLYLLQSGNETGWPNSYCMPMGQFYPVTDSSKIWFGTNNSRIYYSSDYGLHWTAQSTSPEQNSFCIAFGTDYQTGQTLYAGGSNYLLKSTNTGLNWSTISIGGSGNITGITLCWVGWYLARENKIYIRQSYYEDWYVIHTAPAGNYTYVDNRGNGLWVDHYAVRTNGGITFGVEGEGVQKISSEIPNRFMLSQNYPNPFNPTTKIRFDIVPSKGISGITTQLIVFDVLGREVTTLINEQLQPGTYEAEWDASNYPSGVYFYKLITSDYSETRKMVLVK